MLNLFLLPAKLTALIFALLVRRYGWRRATIIFSTGQGISYASQILITAKVARDGGNVLDLRPYPIGATAFGYGPAVWIIMASAIEAYALIDEIVPNINYLSPTPTALLTVAETRELERLFLNVRRTPCNSLG